jgi:Macrocin-O-methyltransferase (TylF)
MPDAIESAPLAPWPFRADPPQRYWANRLRYAERGGLVHLLADADKFVAAQPGNAGDMARFFFFCMVLDQLAKEELPGDIVEIGVYRGATASILANIARRLNRTAYLLDTFEGFADSDLVGIDDDKPSVFDDTSLEQVRAFVGDENVQYIKGHFPATASELPPDGSYCLVHIDCDLYAPTRSALEYFYPRMVPGGFIIVHDYSSLHWDGAETAVDQFFAGRSEAVVPLPDGAGSVVIRKARDPSRDNWIVRRRSRLVTEEWTSAADGRIADLLESGWSDPEPWGVWGVGETHVLLAYLHSEDAGGLEIDADVHAPLVGSRTSENVDVVMAGRRVARWVFTAETNRGTRTAWIPRSAFSEAIEKENGPYIRIEFRPASFEAPDKLDPSLDEIRELGMALHRLRLRELPPTVIPD